MRSTEVVEWEQSIQKLLDGMFTDIHVVPARNSTHVFLHVEYHHPGVGPYWHISDKYALSDPPEQVAARLLPWHAFCAESRP